MDSGQTNAAGWQPDPGGKLPGTRVPDNKPPAEAQPPPLDGNDSTPDTGGNDPAHTI